MKKYFEYREKFDTFQGKTLFEKLDILQQEFIRQMAFHYRFSFQEFRQVVEAARDLSMWCEQDLRSWWQGRITASAGEWPANKKQVLNQIDEHLQSLRAEEKKYAEHSGFRPKKRNAQQVILQDADQTIAGMCPVASDKTICCNLRTIDAVENCLYGCSYCTIQTFYSDKIIIRKNIKEKLDQLELAPDRLYHFCTGQSSDSMAWGNRGGILAAHCQFAAEHSNILMEFKTKSDQISYFLKNDIPPNVFCSWSLNTPQIIKNEEHYTPDLQQRLKAARKVADKKIKVAFHFHPLIWYQGWIDDYPAVAGQLMQEFDPAEVLFVSFGSVTLIKPVIQKIRHLGNRTKTLQMQLVEDPHGKQTYPDEIKIRMFKKMHASFQAWHGKVFFYLCMERADIWQNTFGYVYQQNEDFERQLCMQAMSKIVNG